MSPDNDNRIGPYRVTSTGKRFWPLDPRPEEIEIEVIAHHLAHIGRWGGATARYLSVAEHSIAVSRIVPLADALEGLLHDAEEAYSPFGDVGRPFKGIYSIVAEVERPIAIAVARRFQLQYPWPASVKAADDAVGAAEGQQLIAARDFDLNYRAAPADVKFACLDPDRAEKVFLDRFRILMQWRVAS